MAVRWRNRGRQRRWLKDCVREDLAAVWVAEESAKSRRLVHTVDTRDGI